VSGRLRFTGGPKTGGALVLNRVLSDETRFRVCASVVAFIGALIPELCSDTAIFLFGVGEGSKSSTATAIAAISAFGISSVHGVVHAELTL
jgi:hypothetical protein